MTTAAASARFLMCHLRHLTCVTFLVIKTPDASLGWLEPQISLITWTAGCHLAPEPIRPEREEHSHD
jgi:hypothetical protein